jgi:hypothetical protein
MKKLGSNPIITFTLTILTFFVNWTRTCGRFTIYLLVVKKWCTYLIDHMFTKHTDQISLRKLITQLVEIPEQQFYLAKLLGYYYEILYKLGTQNWVTNALSRIKDNKTSLLGLTVPHLYVMIKFGLISFYLLQTAK